MSGQSTRLCALCRRALLLRRFRLCFRTIKAGRVGYRDSYCLDCRRDYHRAKRQEARHAEGQRRSPHEIRADNAMTFDQVAAALGVSRGRVQQLEMRAFRKIRKALALLFRRDLRRFPDHDLAQLLFRSTPSP